MAFPVEELLSLLNVVGEDDELADRATRILAALVLGSSDSVAFASDRLQINPDAVAKLGAVILARATSVVKANLEGASKALEDGCAKASSESHAADTEAANENEGALREDEERKRQERTCPCFRAPYSCSIGFNRTDCEGSALFRPCFGRMRYCRWCRTSTGIRIRRDCACIALYGVHLGAHLD